MQLKNVKRFCKAVVVVMMMFLVGCNKLPDVDIIITPGPQPGTVTTARLLEIKTVTLDNIPCSAVEVGEVFNSGGDIKLSFADQGNLWELKGFPTDDAKDGTWAGTLKLIKAGGQEWKGSFSFTVYERGQTIVGGYLSIGSDRWYFLAQ